MATLQKAKTFHFLQFWVYFSPLNNIFNHRPTRRTISYYEIIMNYHPNILYAKYCFVRSVGRHLKIKKCVQKWSKIDQKVPTVLYLWLFCTLPWQRLKINEEVQVGKDQEKTQSEKDSHSKNRGGKKPK